MRVVRILIAAVEMPVIVILARLGAIATSMVIEQAQSGYLRPIEALIVVIDIVAFGLALLLALATLRFLLTGRPTYLLVVDLLTVAATSTALVPFVFVDETVLFAACGSVLGAMLLGVSVVGRWVVARVRTSRRVGGSSDASDRAQTRWPPPIGAAMDLSLSTLCGLVVIVDAAYIR